MAQPPKPPPQMLIDGRYQIVRKIGEGGMGSVFEAINTKIDKRVAMKLLSREHAADENAVHRFQREAKAACAIHHRNVVDVLDYGDLPDGSVYYVMEYLEGRDLDELIASERTLPWGRARPILLQAIRGLKAAHDAGVVHRDVKPANIFLVTPKMDDPAHVVKVLDFGIAKLEAGKATKALTAASQVIGTAWYMAPEQAHGRPVDARSDVYAMGVVMYHALSGEVPFPDDEVVRVLFLHATAEPPPLRSKAPEVPPAVEAVVMRCLEKDPATRFQTMRDLEHALSSIDEHGRPTQPSTQPPPVGGFSPVAESGPGPAPVSEVMEIGPEDVIIAPTQILDDTTVPPLGAAEVPKTMELPGIGPLSAGAGQAAGHRRPPTEPDSPPSPSTGPMDNPRLAATTDVGVREAPSSKAVPLLLGLVGGAVALGLGVAVAFTLVRGDETGDEPAPSKVAAKEAPADGSEQLAPASADAAAAQGEEPVIGNEPVVVPEIPTSPPPEPASAGEVVPPEGAPPEPEPDSQPDASPPTTEAPQPEAPKPPPKPKPPATLAQKDARAMSKLRRRGKTECGKPDAPVKVVFTVFDQGWVGLANTKAKGAAAKCLTGYVGKATFPEGPKRKLSVTFK